MFPDSPDTYNKEEGIVRHAGDPWEYKQQNDKFLTRRITDDSSNKWITTKEGSPAHKEIKTTIFDQPSTPSGESIESEIIESTTEVEKPSPNEKRKHKVVQSNTPGTGEWVQTVQEFLYDEGEFLGKSGTGVYAGTGIDGDYGPKTQEAIDNWVKTKKPENSLPIYQLDYTKPMTCSAGGCAANAGIKNTNLLQAILPIDEKTGERPSVWPNNAWFTGYDLVNKQGGKYIYHTNTRNNMNNRVPKELYGMLQVGDYVQLDRWGDSKKGETSKMFPGRKSENIEHLGVIVGMNEDGIPLVYHGSEKRKAYIQPINEEILLPGMTFGTYKYSIASVIRPKAILDADYAKLMNSPEYVNVAIDKENQLVVANTATKYQKGATSVVNNKMKDLVNVGQQYGMSEDDVKNIGQILIGGILQQESEGDESTGREIKEMGSTIAKNWLGIDEISVGIPFTDIEWSKKIKSSEYDEASKSAYQLKPTMNFGTDSSPSIEGRALEYLGLKPSDLKGTGSDISLNPFSSDSYDKDAMSAFTQAGMILMMKHLRDLRKQPGYDASTKTFRGKPEAYALVKMWKSPNYFKKDKHKGYIDKYDVDYSTNALRASKMTMSTEKGSNIGKEVLDKKKKFDKRESTLQARRDKDQKAKTKDYFLSEDFGNVKPEMFYSKAESTQVVGMKQGGPLNFLKGKKKYGHLKKIKVDSDTEETEVVEEVSPEEKKWTQQAEKTTPDGQTRYVGDDTYEQKYSLPPFEVEGEKKEFKSLSDDLGEIGKALPGAAGEAAWELTGAGSVERVLKDPKGTAEGVGNTLLTLGQLMTPMGIVSELENMANQEGYIPGVSGTNISGEDKWSGLEKTLDATVAVPVLGYGTKLAKGALKTAKPSLFSMGAKTTSGPASSLTTTGAGRLVRTNTPNVARPRNSKIVGRILDETDGNGNFRVSNPQNRKELLKEQQELLQRELAYLKKRQAKEDASGVPWEDYYDADFERHARQKLKYQANQLNEELAKGNYGTSASNDIIDEAIVKLNNPAAFEKLKGIGVKEPKKFMEWLEQNVQYTTNPGEGGMVVHAKSGQIQNRPVRMNTGAGHVEQSAWGQNIVGPKGDNVSRTVDHEFGHLIQLYQKEMKLAKTGGKGDPNFVAGMKGNVADDVTLFDKELTAFFQKHKIATKKELRREAEGGASGKKGFESIERDLDYLTQGKLDDYAFKNSNLNRQVMMDQTMDSIKESKRLLKKWKKFIEPRTEEASQGALKIIRKEEKLLAQNRKIYQNLEARQKVVNKNKKKAKADFYANQNAEPLAHMRELRNEIYQSGLLGKVNAKHTNFQNKVTPEILEEFITIGSKENLYRAKWGGEKQIYNTYAEGKRTSLVENRILKTQSVYTGKSTMKKIDGRRSYEYEFNNDYLKELSALLNRTPVVTGVTAAGVGTAANMKKGGPIPKFHTGGHIHNHPHETASKKPRSIYETKGYQDFTEGKITATGEPVKETPPMTFEEKLDAASVAGMVAEPAGTIIDAAGALYYGGKAGVKAIKGEEYGEDLTTAGMWTAGVFAPFAAGAVINKVGKPLIKKVKSIFSKTPPSNLRFTNPSGVMSDAAKSITKSDITTIADNVTKRLKTDKFIKNRMDATGESREQVLKVIDDYVDEFRNAEIRFTDKIGNAGGMYTPGVVHITGSKEGREKMLGTIEHELHHLFSDTKGPGISVGGKRIGTGGTYANYPETKLLEDSRFYSYKGAGPQYFQWPAEQQARFRKAIGWLERHGGLKQGEEITDEMVEKLAKGLNEGGEKYATKKHTTIVELDGTRTFYKKGDYMGGVKGGEDFYGYDDDVRDVFDVMDVKKYLGDNAAFMGTPDQQKMKVGGDMWKKAVKEVLNKTYAVAPAIIGGKMLKEGMKEEGYKKGGPLIDKNKKPSRKIRKGDPELKNWNRFNTNLTLGEKKRFKSWTKEQGNLWDKGAYDVQGFWKETIDKGIDVRDEGGHGPDTYKKPNHPTFSNQSQYAGKQNNPGGTWVEPGRNVDPRTVGAYHPSDATKKIHGGKGFYDWFFSREKGRIEHYGPDYKKGGKTNPWAICTKSVGRSDKAKYERCVKKVKRKSMKRGGLIDMICQ